MIKNSRIVSGLIIKITAIKIAHVAKSSNVPSRSFLLEKECIETSKIIKTQAHKQLHLQKLKIGDKTMFQKLLPFRLEPAQHQLLLFAKYQFFLFQHSPSARHLR
jgi:hypothetical protein